MIPGGNSYVDKGMKSARNSKHAGKYIELSSFF